MTDSITREVLAEILETRGVGDDRYHLYGAHLDQAVVMDHRGSEWVVFFSDRGVESGLRYFGNEQAACQFVLELFEEETR